MAQGWTVAELLDMVVSCQHDLGELKVTNLMFDLTAYPGWTEIFKKEKSVIEGGTALDFNLSLTTNGTAHSMKLMEPVDFNDSDSLTTGSVPWKHMSADYVMNRIRSNMNKGKRRLVNEIKLKRDRAFGDLVKFAENIIWAAPVSGSLDFYGVQYWIVRWPTGTITPGFTGTVPDGFSDVAGKACTGATAAYTNWAGQYLAVTKNDLVKKMKRMSRKTNFKAPISLGNPDYKDGGRQRAYYTNIDVVEEMEDLAEMQNDRLGVDLDPMEGRPRFQRAPLIYVPQLDADASDPVYQIDWSQFDLRFLEGEEMVETTEKVGNDPRSVGTLIDCTCQTVCENRRPHGVLSKTSKTGTSS